MFKKDMNRNERTVSGTGVTIFAAILVLAALAAALLGNPRSPISINGSRTHLLSAQECDSPHCWTNRAQIMKRQ